MSPRTFSFAAGSAFLLGALILAFGARLAPYEVWAIDAGRNTIHVLDREGEERRVVAGDGPGGPILLNRLFTVAGDHRVYAPDAAAGAVAILARMDGALRTIVEEVGVAPVAAYPHPVRRDKVYVLNAGSGAGGSIAELVRTPGRAEVWDVTRSLDLPAAPACAAPGRDGGHLVVTFSEGGLAAVELEGWRIARTWDASEVAGGGCVFGGGQGGADLYVTSGGPAAAWLFVVAADEDEPRIAARHDLSAAGADPRGAFVDRRRNELWVLHHATGSATIHPLETIREAGHVWETMAGIGAAPSGGAVSPDGRRGFVALGGADAPGVAIVDLPTRSLVRTVPLGEAGVSAFRGVFIPLSE